MRAFFPDKVGHIVLSGLLLIGSVPALSYEFRPDDIVDVRTVEPRIMVDMMYFSSDNFLGRKVRGYQENVCLLSVQAADALKKAHLRLVNAGRKHGKNYSFLVRDCYRPQKAVDDFMSWINDGNDLLTKKNYYPRLTKEDLVKKGYIAPVSGHSRASSIDLTIVEVSGGDKLKSSDSTELDMGSRLDFFGEESHTDYTKLSPAARRNRQLLLDVMAPEFKNYKKEWWHFVLKDEPFPTNQFDFDVMIVPKEKTPGRLNPATSLGKGTIEDFNSLIIDDPAVLGRLDANWKSPLSLASIFTEIHRQNGFPFPKINEMTTTRASTKNLMAYENSYSEIVNVISYDIDRIVKEMAIDWEKDITKTYSPAAARTSDGKKFRRNGNVMRVFNQKWLDSADGQFVLSGIVNRLDRRDFDQTAEKGKSGCGEVRFIYRLAYALKNEGKTYASRMPFTMNVVFENPDDGSVCQKTAVSWNTWKVSDEAPEQMVRRLLAGPLSLSRMKFKQLEVNAQVARFPSDLERDEKRYFAGQALYWMRIFAGNKGRLRPVKLENTPDVAALKDPRRRRELMTFVSEKISSIDLGVFQVPDKFLSDVALSWSTLGNARSGNRPWDQVFTLSEAEELVSDSGLSKEKAQFISGGASLLERLNTSTCMGCHQNASTAGFHFLGPDRFDYGGDTTVVKKATDGNRLALPFSPHLYADLQRRQRYLINVMEGKVPDSFREHPARPFVADALADMPCLTGEKTGALAGRASWKCANQGGLRCQVPIVNPDVTFTTGICITSNDRIHAGLSCRQYDVKNHAQNSDDKLAWNLMGFRDRVKSDRQIYRLPEGKVSDLYNCRPTAIGVPLGRISRNCTAEERSLTNDVDRTGNICAVVGGKGFEEMAKGFFDSERFGQGVGRGMLNACDPERPCREDYICQQIPDFLSGKKFNVSRRIVDQLQLKRTGFCTPTYFVYQLRLDGHPNPK